MRGIVIAAATVLCGVVLQLDALGAPRDFVGRTATAPVPKPSGPLELTYRLDGAIRVGAPLDVELTVRGVSLEAPRLEAAPSNGALAIIAQSAAVAIDGGFRWTMTVLPLAPAAAYVTVVATARIDGLEQSRSLVIPVRTSAEVQAPVGAPMPAAGAERLILLPAQEPGPPR